MVAPKDESVVSGKIKKFVILAQIDFFVYLSNQII